MLHAIEEAALENESVRLLMPHIFKHVYEELNDFEEVIISWYDVLQSDSVLRPVMKTFVEWLMQDDDEDEDDDDDSEA